MISPTITSIDTSNLRRAMAISEQYSQRTPQAMVSTAGFFIARKVSRDTHRASLTDIDSKLGVEAGPQILSQRGKRKGMPLKSGKRILVSSGDQSKFTVAEMIVMARLSAKSKYNVETNQRWAIDRATFSPGGGVLGFLLAVHARSLTMASRRHSSISFLASSALPIIRTLEALVAPEYRRGSGQTDAGTVDHNTGVYKKPLGAATVTSNGNNASMEGDFNVGVGYNSLIGEQGNKAMWEYLAPVLQVAVDTEAARTMDYVAKHEMEHRSTALLGCGAIVTTNP